VILKYSIQGPKVLSIANGLLGGAPTSLSGSQDGETHYLLVFPHPELVNAQFVIDLTRMQYGVQGAGLYDEPYFLGTLTQWKFTMLRLCESVEDISTGATRIVVSEREEWLKACAKKVWQRWMERDSVGGGWCDYCGKEGN
jgi:hypothetical protein